MDDRKTSWQGVRCTGERLAGNGCRLMGSGSQAVDIGSAGNRVSASSPLPVSASGAKSATTVEYKLWDKSLGYA